MIKKIMACILSLAMICCTCISAKALESDEPSIPIDSSKFIIMSEGDSNYVGVSVSYIEHNFSAIRLDDGRVKVTINETFHSVRGYYEHLATDSTGQYFLPNRNTAYYTYAQSPKTYEMYLSTDTISTEGYVYIKFAIAPVGGDTQLCTTYYKIPVK